MKVRQYAYFAVRSSHVTAIDVERRLGTAADRALVAGSKSSHPLRPAAHAWQLVCDEGGLTVDEQIARLVVRLRPMRKSLRELAAEGDVSLVLQVVRYLNDDDGEQEDLTPAAGGMEKLPGQHQLLGWHLDAEVIDFLADIHAEIDCDEYG